MDLHLLILEQIGESLPPESMRLLHHIHPSIPARVAEDVASGVHIPCTGNASAWASETMEERHAIMNPFGHGLHLDRAGFDETLRDSVRKSGGDTTPVRIEMVHGRFKTAEVVDGCWIVQVDIDGKERRFAGAWVIDATGRKASVATKVSCSGLS